MNSDNSPENQVLATTYPPPSRLILHCCHHKVGTLWFRRILSDIAQEFGWDFQNCEQHELKSSTHIFFQRHSVIQRKKLRPYVGSHMIRDPRDIIISGYFYHLWCKERWCNRRRLLLLGKSYQQHLNSLPQDEGILFEMKFGSRKTIKNMANWDYRDENFFEVRYEELFSDEIAGFKKIFQAYGFNEKQVDQALIISQRHSFKNQVKKKAKNPARGKHLRKGTSGDWKNYFKPIHIEAFKQIYPNVLVKLGYEESEDW